MSEDKFTELKNYLIKRRKHLIAVCCDNEDRGRKQNPKEEYEIEFIRELIKRMEKM